VNLFLTGTDTGVGKTYVTCLLARAFLARGESVTPAKPICCGDRDDAARLLQAAQFPDLTLDDVNPQCLQAPAAPLAAATIENRSLSIRELVEHVRGLQGRADHLLVEGVGGWEVPITETEAVSDLAKALGYPVVVVVDNKLGALNHTILTVRSIQSAGLPLAGLLLNHPREERDSASISNRIVLETFLEAPVLAEVLYDEDELDLTGWDERVADATG